MIFNGTSARPARNTGFNGELAARKRSSKIREEPSLISRSVGPSWLGLSGRYYTLTATTQASVRQCSEGSRAPIPTLWNRNFGFLALLCSGWFGTQRSLRLYLQGRCLYRAPIQIRFPCASNVSTSPNSAACSAISARSPAITICACAESKYFRAASSTSPDVSARTCSRYVSR
jgi:hypothetical protein